LSLENTNNGDPMQRIKNDISQGQFHTIYLLYGEERYLKNQFTEKLRQALCAPDDTMNVSKYNGKGISIPEIIDLAETMPFLADRRVIFIEDSGLLKSGGETLAEYLETPCDSTVFVFTESEVDKRSRLFKAITKNGIAVDFSIQDEETLLRWIAGMMKKEGKQFSESTLRLFLSKSGTDMSNIRMELEKLLCYCMQKDVITAEDVETICAVTITDTIFGMVEALGKDNRKAAVGMYYDLIANKEAPARILYMISRHFNQLLQIKMLSGSGFQQNAIASKVGLSPFIVSKLMRQTSNFSPSALKRAVEQCVEAEEAFKTGAMQEAISVEMLLLTVGKTES